MKHKDVSRMSRKKLAKLASDDKHPLSQSAQQRLAIIKPKMKDAPK